MAEGRVGAAGSNGTGAAEAEVPDRAERAGAAAEVFAGPGEMRAHARALDWGATPLGPVERWAPALRAAVRFCADAGFPTCLYAGDALVLVYNDGFVAALGRKSPWALGRPAAEVWPEAWERIATDLARVRETGEPVVRPDQHFVLEGGPGGADERFYTFALSPVRDEAGAIVGVLSTVVETTGQVRATAALAADRRRLRTVLDAAPAVVAVYSGPAHVLTYVNPTWERVVGKPGALGRTVREVFPEMISTGIWERLDRVYETGEAWTVSEIPLPIQRHPDGPVEESVWSFVWMPLPGAYPEGPAEHGGDVLVHAVEVTAQVRAREESDAAREALAQANRELVERTAAAERAAGDLASSERRLRLALELAELGTWSWELATGAGHLDARGAEIVGLPPGGLADVGAAQFASIHPDDVAPTQAAAAAGIAGGVPFTLAYRVRHPDGRIHHVASRAVVVADAEGRPVRLVGTNRDVTAEREAAAERERLLAEAEAARVAAETANRGKSEFLATMSHELRTPLNAIGGYAELIELGIHGPVTPEQRAALARIQMSQRHLLGLISGVLDYSRVEAGAVSYRIVEVPVTEAVAEAEALVAPQLHAKGLGYGWSGAPPGLRVRADREKLQQILLNLLGNAIKFTHADDGCPGRIEVSCAAEDPAPDGRPGRVLLRVGDSGQGIAPHELERIFEPFVQVDQRLTRAHAGVGLGLAISRDLARGMGGDLTVESAVGEGSTFTLTLPSALALAEGHPR